MSWLDGMVEDNEAASQDQRLERTAEGLQPGAFTGALSAIGPGLLRGGLEAGAAVESGFSSLWQTGLDTAASMLLPEPKFGGTPNVTSAEESSQETLGQGTASEVMRLRPDPAEVGMVGQILGEAAAVLPRAVVGTVLAGPAGTAIAAGAPAGYSGKQVGIAEGLDPETATKKGLIDAATVGIGAALPAARFVKPLLGDLGIAVGANVGLGMAGRGATAALLDSNGYHAQAEQYKVMDGTALITDAVLGAAFFGLGRAGMRRPTTAHVDAALTERTTQHADVDTAPGAPINPRSAMAHQDAIRTAIDQISRGEPVVLPDSIHSAQFLRETDSAPTMKPAPDVALATARQDLEPTLRIELEQEAAGILPNVKDVKAELSSVARSLEALDGSIKARAKEFQQQGQGRKQAEQSARQAVEAERLDLSDRQASLNESLGGNRTAEQARADLNALDRGEVPQRLQDRISQRADTIVKGFDKKPLSAGVAEANTKLTMAQIARQEITRILDDIERAEPTLQAKPLDIGTSKDVAKPEGVANAGGKQTGKSGQPEVTTPDKPGAEVVNDAGKPGNEAADPVVQVADEIMARVDDMRISTGAMDEDGNAITVSAKELMASADADIARAQQDSKGFAAAAACFLQRGL
ncbi:hypothetical protein GIW54_07095 [Pseudomonas proteolytica]|uniref:Uncharacterized protein n=1 Tax=Pseudomonas proteolytica TaxID=219574 RepID=A0AAW5A3P4_9PSED|nr:hypothetical protein [Pseudomonas proteolytica]MCF5056023.1 hypothetical protein [Pseudomonas proteolytica]MCF5100529.1 hypothetical protein [Pseudomonas proteolytica]